ncbi:alpha/beta hydrolase [Myxococcus sp. K15C18031901]|uniref:alpha/beta fold hydrolase n=1 Tax=Myxococcus dinghuensis TaxID=2906761 RepID=UPI0020A754EF|nr:alpha/beta hydrolase [Myxococcus dinghuensis]MCP3099304.1 alpha/beta hydrolase [Myxococcus dinghuensis]
MNWRAWQRMQDVVELGDRFLSYVDLGDGPPVVLLHGIPTWGYVWSGLAAGLATTNRVLVPDLLGYGFSDKRDVFDRSVGRQAEALDAWMDRLGLVDALVVGHDVGGGVAQHLAVRFPRRVGRLCLVDSICYDAWPLSLMSLLGTPSATRRLSPERVGRLLRLALRWKGFETAPPDGVVEGLLAPYATEVGLVSLVRDAVALDTNQTRELAPRLGHVSVPTLLLWGEEDALLPARYGERLAWDIPGARLVQVPDARHFVMWDAPHAVATELFRFMELEVPVGRVFEAGTARPRRVEAELLFDSDAPAPA